MSYDIERLRRWIPNGDGHYSDFAGDLVESIEEIEALRAQLAEANRKLQEKDNELINCLSCLFEKVGEENG